MSLYFKAGLAVAKKLGIIFSKILSTKILNILKKTNFARFRFGFQILKKDALKYFKLNHEKNRAQPHPPAPRRPFDFYGHFGYLFFTPNTGRSAASRRHRPQHRNVARGS